MYIYDNNPHKKQYKAFGFMHGQVDAATVPTKELGQRIDIATDKAEHAHLERDRWYYAGYAQGVQAKVDEQFNAVPSYIERFRDRQAEE
jgi:hypothetical protein